MTEQSIAYRIEHETPGHVTIGVFAGPRGFTRGKAGELVFSVEEWPEIKAILDEGGFEKALP